MGITKQALNRRRRTLAIPTAGYDKRGRPYSTVTQYETWVAAWHSYQHMTGDRRKFRDTWNQRIRKLNVQHGYYYDRVKTNEKDS